ncbi:MAG TPA: hypothetical protein VLG74_05550, partial [Blastocatellia bacterium]|nr:hypothetical protein [Blastocatellia bacterium]
AHLIGGSLDLESGSRLDSSDETLERNAAVLRRLEAQVTEEVERAASEALESAKANMPVGASAAEGVYAASNEFLNEAVAAS